MTIGVEPVRVNKRYARIVVLREAWLEGVSRAAMPRPIDILICDDDRIGAAKLSGRMILIRPGRVARIGVVEG